MLLTTSLGRRGYGIEKRPGDPENEAYLASLRERLTVKPLVNPNVIGSEEVRAFPVYQESSKKLYVPRVFGLEHVGDALLRREFVQHPGEDWPRRPSGPSGSAAPVAPSGPSGPSGPLLVFQGSLRPEQEAPVAAFLRAARDPRQMGGILELSTGFGKTAIALYLASQFQKKTLVVCHKEFLMNQWRERIAAFLPGARIGLIRQSKVQTDQHDIVIASLQSLAMREYPAELFRAFGFAIFDEVHHLGAEVFSRALFRIGAPVLLGLSATIKRSDGLSKVFMWHIGKPVFTVRTRTDCPVEVAVLRYYSPDPDYSQERQVYGRKLNTPRMVTAITQYVPRNQVLLEALLGLLARDPGRRTLILSHRIQHLRSLEKQLRALGYTGTIGYYIGGMKEDQLRQSQAADLMMGTVTMCSEGMDCPHLDTLVLATPMASVEQAVGRIQRRKLTDCRYPPLVIDLIDEFSIFDRQGRARLRFYRSKSYRIHHGPPTGPSAATEDNPGTEDNPTEDNPDSPSEPSVPSADLKAPRRYAFLDDEEEPALSKSVG